LNVGKGVVVPKNLLYKTSNVVYFKGDLSSFFYVLKSGKVAITTADDISQLSEANSNDTSRRILNVGEFFGVRAALSGLPQDESAVALIPSEVVALNHKEFEEIASKHPDIIIKLLRVYSSQLVETHQIVNNLIRQNSDERKIDAESGLFSIGFYFLKNRLYRQCAEAFKRYLQHYPTGANAADAKAKIDYAESRIGSNEDNEARFFPSSTTSGNGRADTRQLNEAETFFNEAKNLFEQRQYTTCVIRFSRIVRETDPDYGPFMAESQYLLSEAFFNLKKYDEITLELPSYFQKFPDGKNTQDVLYLLARTYEALNDKERAMIFYQKLYSLLGDDSPLKGKVRGLIST
jgi:CRP-like cAMP-binding protein